MAPLLALSTRVRCSRNMLPNITGRLLFCVDFRMSFLRMAPLLALSTRDGCSRNMLHNVTGSFFMTPGMNEDHLKVLCRFQNVFSQDGTALSFVNEGWVLKKHASQRYR